MNPINKFYVVEVFQRLRMKILLMRNFSTCCPFSNPILSKCRSSIFVKLKYKDLNKMSKEVLVVEIFIKHNKVIRLSFSFVIYINDKVKIKFLCFNLKPNLCKNSRLKMLCKSF